jgi:uncharacterized membrane protein
VGKEVTGSGQVREGSMSREVVRWMLSIGPVAAMVGLTIFGMGIAFVEPRDAEVNIGIALMVIGVAMTIVGAVLYRATEKAAPARSAPRSGERR